jgi:hypothetical protein
MTAVEWLAEQIKEYDFSPRDNTYLIEIPYWILTEKIQQAKEMEKQQLQECWGISHQAGRYEGKGIAEENWQTFEDYWNEINL